MLIRTIIVWFGLMLVAIANGAFREAVLVPRFGTASAHVLSTLTLCLSIVVITFAVIRWIGPREPPDAIVIGAVWLALTLLFEFGFGHYVAHKPWTELLADYNLLAGRIWIFVLIVVFLSPYVAARVRGFL